MSSVDVVFDSKSFIISNVLSANETISYDWVIDEEYQILLTKGNAQINGSLHEAISVITIAENTKLSVIAADEEVSFLVLLRSDNRSVMNQLLPEDRNFNYYDTIQNNSPEWNVDNLTNRPAVSMKSIIGDKVLSSSDIKRIIAKSLR
jgi:hypothetical protein